MSPRAWRRRATSRSAAGRAAAAGEGSAPWPAAAIPTPTSGKVITAAYFNAFTDLVHYMQAQSPGQQAASAPAASQHATGPVTVRAAPSAAARIVYRLQPGQLVFPTGQRNGVWMEVDDENGNRGWAPSTMMSSR